MKNILHDWSDEESIIILTNLRGALEPGGAVVLLEGVVPEPGQGGSGNGIIWLDMIMLVSATWRTGWCCCWCRLHTGRQAD
jgi:hypothetical protein